MFSCLGNTGVSDARQRGNLSSLPLVLLIVRATSGQIACKVNEVAALLAGAPRTKGYLYACASFAVSGPQMSILR